MLLAKINSFSKITVDVILDHLARQLVLAGDQLCKHTKQGKGAPHMKMVRMLKFGVHGGSHGEEMFTLRNPC